MTWQERWAERLGAVSRHQWWLRGAMVLATALFVVLVSMAGEVSTVAVLAVPLATAVAAAAPHTQLPTALMVFLIGLWFGGVPAGWHPELIPAAWSLLCLHTLFALAAAFPIGATLPRTVLAHMARRVLVVAALTGLLGVLLWVVTDVTLPGGPYPAIAGLAVLVVLLVLHYRGVTRADAGASPASKNRERPLDRRWRDNLSR